MKTQLIALLSLTTHITTIFSCQSQTDTRAIDQVIESHLRENNIPGMAVGIVKGNDLIFSKGYGFADLNAEVEMSPEMIMNIASISKTITSTAVMQLWEQGKLDLDEDINNYLPISVRNPHFSETPITIQQLLTHTSSIVDGSAYRNSYACGDPVITLHDWIIGYLTKEGEYYNSKENFIAEPPGTKYQYSNVGYGLLAFIVEELTHQPFDQYCRENIFKPLGMQHTSWYIKDIEREKHATPYIYVNKDNRKMIMNEYKDFFPGENDFKTGTNIGLCLYSFSNYPDGLIRTNVEELSHFLLAIMNDGEYIHHQILKKSTIDKMLSPQGQDNSSQGLCWHRSDFESLWGHSGGDPGVLTHMYFSRDTRIGIILFQNNNEGDQFEVLKKIYALLAQQ